MPVIAKTEKKLPAGDYWVGDPCYFVPDDLWAAWLTAAGIDNTPIPQIMDGVVAGHRVAASGTMHGDGAYSSNVGFRFPVDAGLIGVVPVGLVPDGDARLGVIVHFEEPFHIRYTESGKIKIGHVEIKTG